MRADQTIREEEREAEVRRNILINKLRGGRTMAKSQHCAHLEADLEEDEGQGHARGGAFIPNRAAIFAEAGRITINIWDGKYPARKPKMELCLIAKYAEVLADNIQRAVADSRAEAEEEAEAEGEALGTDCCGYVHGYTD